MKAKTEAHSHAWLGGIMGLERLRRRVPDENGYDFGWSWGAMNGLWLAAAALLTVALGLQLELPRLWPAWFAFCFFLTSKAAWRTLARNVGFVIRDEGTFNGMWFAVLEKPR